MAFGENCMKGFTVLVISLSCFFGLALTTFAGETANARMYCLSLSFSYVYDSSGIYSLQLPDNELWPYDANSNAADVTVVDIVGDSYPGYIILGIPNTIDANGDGFPDFFESSQEVSASTTGSYNVPGWGTGTLVANWSRFAGTSYGTCVLYFDVIPNYPQSTFVIPFQLLEFTGPLAYTPGASNVTANVNLVQTDVTNNTLQGSLLFTKNPTNRFNLLMLQPGVLTNASQQALTFTNNVFRRDNAWPTNYYGYVVFDNYDPNSAAPAYQVWTLSIDDTNDYNHNGIPDFSDDPQTTLPRPPVLSLLATGTNVLLAINGDTNHVYEVQQTASLAPPIWINVTSLLLTNNIVSVPLATPAGPASFWRVVAR